MQPSVQAAAANIRPSPAPAGGSRQLRRRGRYTARRALWRDSTLKRVKACGRRRVAREADVTVHRTTGEDGSAVAHFGNVQLCGSVHACPVCAPRVRSERAAEIEHALRLHLAAGGRALFVTLTLPHDQGDQLAPLLDTVANGFRAVLAGRAWAGENRVRRSGGEVVERWHVPGVRERAGVIGTIRALEVTYGANGWHPHLHVLVLIDGDGDDPLLIDHVRSTWERFVVGAGYRRPGRNVGVDVRPVRTLREVAQYTSKVYDEAGAGFELARHDLKRGRRSGSRNPFGILADYVAGLEVGHQDDGDLALWRTYEQASHGRQALTWSKGLKARFGVGERTDEEIAAEQIGGEVVFTLTADAWVRVVGTPRAMEDVLDAAEGPDPLMQIGAIVRRLLAGSG